MTAPSKDMRVASQGGTRPLCKGRIAVPDRFAIASHVQVRSKAYQPDVPTSDPFLMVRNVIEYLGASTAGMLCSMSRRAGHHVERPGFGIDREAIPLAREKEKFGLFEKPLDGVRRMDDSRSSDSPILWHRLKR